MIFESIFQDWKPSIRDYYDCELSKRELKERSLNRTRFYIVKNNIHLYSTKAFDTDIVHLSNNNKLELVFSVFHYTPSKNNFETSFSILLEIHPRLISIYYDVNKYLNIRHLSAIVMSYITDDVYYLSLDRYMKIMNEVYKENDNFGSNSNNNLEGCYWKSESEENKIITLFTPQHGYNRLTRYVINYDDYPTEEMIDELDNDKFEKYDIEYDMYEEFDYLYG
jgi:hypothetical protein